MIFTHAFVLHPKNIQRSFKAIFPRNNYHDGFINSSMTGEAMNLDVKLHD